MATQPTIPKGTRDFLPIEMVRRNYIFDTIKKVFKLFGYMPIETPAMETLNTLMGKYGEEGDRLIFKILNSGNYLSKVQEEEISRENSIKLSYKICEKALRYDLTVPFARFVVQHRNDIQFPFKRFQIQPVWRADRPQKGRYREFFQCDVDVIGSNSLLNEVELVQIIDEVFNNLNLNTIIKINNRKVLAGIAEVIGHQDKFVDITVAIDKLEKIGLENVNKELLSKGLTDDAIAKLQPFFTIKGTNSEKLNIMRDLLQNSETGMKGVEELDTVFSYIDSFELKADIDFDITLARGLNYYTGAIFEVVAKDVKIGSICGGGRYDDLTGIFGLKDVSGVGVSFGADRIYDVINQLDNFPESAEATTKLMFVNFGKDEEKHCLPLLAKVRNAGINAEIYPESSKMKKQMTYANKKGVAFVALIGQNEIEKGIVNLKNMQTGEQKDVTVDELIKELS